MKRPVRINLLMALTTGLLFGANASLAISTPPLRSSRSTIATAPIGGTHQPLTINPLLGRNQHPTPLAKLEKITVRDPILGEQSFLQIPLEIHREALRTGGLIDFVGQSGEARSQRVLQVGDLGTINQEQRSAALHEALLQTYRLMRPGPGGERGFLRKAAKLYAMDLVFEFSDAIVARGASTEDLPEFLRNNEKDPRLTEAVQKVRAALKSGLVGGHTFADAVELRNSVRNDPARVAHELRDLLGVLTEFSEKFVEIIGFEVGAVQTEDSHGATETVYFSSGLLGEVKIEDFFQGIKDLKGGTQGKVIRFLHSHPGPGRPLSGGDIGVLRGQFAAAFPRNQIEIYAVGQRPDLPDSIHAYFAIQAATSPR